MAAVRKRTPNASRDGANASQETSGDVGAVGGNAMEKQVAEH